MLRNRVPASSGITCRHAADFASGKFAADVSLVRAWEVKNYDPKPPSVTRFQKGNKQLSYLETLHSNELNCETFKKIKEELSDFKPDVVILEDLETSKGMSPKKWDMSFPLDNQNWDCGEPCYTAALAFEKNIPYIGGEPDDLDFTNTLREKGYTDRDILGFLLARQIPQWLRENEPKPFDLKRFFEKNQDWLAADSFLDEDAKFSSPEDFIKWYKERNKIGLVTDDESANIVAPMNGPNVLFTQKMAFEGTRDGNITFVIASMLNRYDRVMVVYGAGHLYQGGLILKDMFSEYPR